METSPGWEIIVSNGEVLRNISDLQTHHNGSLSVWLDGRRYFIPGEPFVLTQPDFVLSRSAWVAYRPTTNT